VCSSAISSTPLKGLEKSLQCTRNEAQVSNNKKPVSH
jgi:hypothetical protein